MKIKSIFGKKQRILLSACAVVLSLTALLAYKAPRKAFADVTPVEISSIDFGVVKEDGVALSAMKPLGTGRVYTYKHGEDTHYNVEANDAYSLQKAVNVTQSIAYYSERVVNGSRVPVSQTFGFREGEAYTVTGSEFTKSASKDYSVTVNIAPQAGYTLKVSDTAALAARGITVSKAAGESYDVTKTFYLVEETNAFVTESGALYSAHDVTFGEEALPALHAATDDAACKISLRYKGAGATEYNTVCSRVDASEWANYVNSSMPAGDYQLTARVLGTGVYHQAVKDFFFTVKGAPLPANPIADFMLAFRDQDSGNGTSFMFVPDGNVHLFDATAEDAIAALRSALEEYVPTRLGVWSNSQYDSLYHSFEMTYSYNNSDYTAKEALLASEGAPKLPGSYPVYYKITASNCAPLVDPSLDEETQVQWRSYYRFYTVITNEVALPTLASAIYNGSAQKAAIYDNELYTVENYDGFTQAGTYSVKLTLRHPEYCHWAGMKVNEPVYMAPFEIAKAANGWRVPPEIQAWTEGEYNLDTNCFIGAAEYGYVFYSVTDVAGNVIFDSANGVNELANAKAGKYILKATVYGTDDYNSISKATVIRILSKDGLPWWASLLIVVGALAVFAAVILVLWKRGVFRILTTKAIIAIRTKATVDATIASVRANLVAEEARKAAAEREAKERGEALAKARKAAAERSPEEKAAALEAKAQAAAERLERMKTKADALQSQSESKNEEEASDADGE